MPSQFNTLYLGPANEAADLLELMSERTISVSDHDAIRIALINALRRIHRLENNLADLDHSLRGDV